ncbi:MAG: ABC-type uncharacterized transport system involved in gliding motility auxiliary subunit [Phenylobacterium sp.]|jgi:ABC-type uncharacterized transport system involved in gliding motility auxiliary subunit
MKNVSNSVSLLAIAFLFVGAVLLNNVLFDRARVDLTENSIYSITEGSKTLLTQLDEPINLYFFFSNKTSEGITSVRTYASRVQSLLEEMELYSDGKINLHIIDPEPFSEAEDRAAEFGLSAPSINQAGDSLYFGLGGTNALDERQVIAFFDPQKEAFLEYDIAKMIYQLTNPDPIKVTLISSLDMKGGQNPMTGQATPSWAILQQLEQLYKVESVEPTASAIPEDTSVLMLVGPKDYNESLLYSIDQFVLKGGKVVVYADPHAEAGQQGQQQQFAANSSDLSRLFKAWGVEFDPNKVALDAAKGLEIQMPSGNVGRHVGYIGLGAGDVNPDDVITADLQSINGASFGVLSVAEGATTTFSAILRSSEHSQQVESMLYVMQSRSPEAMLKSFKSDGELLTLAARITGKASSAFETAPEGIDAASMVKESQDIQVIIIADTDLLTDQFWVSQQNFFGSVVLSPFAGNGDLATNIIENLGGSSTLISVRGRGKYARAFDVVEALKIEAETKFREKEQALEDRLKQTEAQLNQLQTQQGSDGALVLNAEQEQMVESFVQQRIGIRKELREVRHQLDKDIEILGSKLKFITIVLMPLLLTLLLAFFARRHRRKVIL